AAEGLDRGAIAGQEPPPLLRARPIVALQIGGFLGRREIGTLAGIEAERDDLQRTIDALEARQEPVQDQRAEPGATIIDGSQDEGVPSGRLPERDRRARLVAEDEVQRNRAAALLIHAAPVQ